MEKVLIKYKTIPEHLYVQRNADKQLRLIIEEMQSPGYVLVARQMGKTNLLFNAQRDLASEYRLFVYVDLSNLFESERDCYQNIIDNIIEQNEETLEKVETRIREIRKDELEPHKEYTRSLRAILKLFDGDIIIILDEIDALRNVNYSDHIFAQIRSTYFQRKPFPEYERLTYILSGVIEPKDLIKDKNKSPFNIGEKIYLDDFSMEEHQEFIVKSQLKIAQELSDEIFAWTSGNPRLTFDICAEIENCIFSGDIIDKELISEIIHKRYLTDFDIPPIDHIRERVRANKHAQKAILSLQNGNNDISDELRKKLYLYGIIGSSLSKNIVIKNKIIQESLSSEWIENLTNEVEEIFEKAMSKYVEEDYNAAILDYKLILSLIDTVEVSDDIIESSNYYIGRSYHYLREFNDAIAYLKFDYKNEKRKRNAFSTLGSSLLLSDFNQAVDIFNKIIDIKVYDWAHNNALLSLGINLIKKDEDRALCLFKELYQSTFSSNHNDEKIDDLLKVRTLSLYYQFVIYDKNETRVEALNCLREAIKYATPSDCLYFMYHIYLSEKDTQVKNEIILKIISDKIILSKEKVYPFTFIESDLFKYIDLIFENKDLLEKIINYSLDDIYNNKKNQYELLYEVSRISSEHKINYLNMIISEKGLIDQLLYMKAVRDKSLIARDNKYHFFKDFDEFFALFQGYVDELSEEDFYAFLYAIRNKIEHKSFPDALIYGNVIERRLEESEDENLKMGLIFIYYFQADIHFELKKMDKAILYAKKAMSLLEKPEGELSILLDKEGMKVMKAKLHKIFKLEKKEEIVDQIKKYGRNEIVRVMYLDGRIEEKKYKKVENDLLAKRCREI